MANRVSQTRKIIGELCEYWVLDKGGMSAVELRARLEEHYPFLARRIRSKGMDLPREVRWALQERKNAGGIEAIVGTDGRTLIWSPTLEV